MSSSFNGFGNINENTWSAGKKEIPPSPNSLVLGKNDVYGVDLTASCIQNQILNTAQSQTSSPSLKSKRFCQALDLAHLNEAFSPLDLDIEEISNFKELNLLKEEMIKQAKPFAEDFDKILEDIQTLEGELSRLREDYKSMMSNLNEYGHWQENILDILYYFNINHDNLLLALRPFISLEHFHLIQSYLDKGEDFFKLLDPAAQGTFNAAKLGIILQTQDSLKAFFNRYSEFKSKVKSLPFTDFSFNEEFTTRTSQLRANIKKMKEQLDKDEKTNLDKVKPRAEKVAGKLFKWPLAYLIEEKAANKVGKQGFGVFKEFRNIRNIQQAYVLQQEWKHHLGPRIILDSRETPQTQQVLFDELKTFLDSLAECTTIKEVKQKIKKMGMTIEIPPYFEDWETLFNHKRFRRYLIQSYYHKVGRRPVVNKDQMSDLLCKRHTDHVNKVKNYLPCISNHVLACQELKFEEIKKFFAKLHIHIEDLKNPPINKEQWEQKIEEIGFCESLAEQWVSYQETTAQLAEQAARQALLSKQEVERKFLIYRSAENVISIISSLIQLISIFPGTKGGWIPAILKYLSLDLAKEGAPGLGFIYFLYPDMSLKLESLILVFTEYYFAVRYKPHEFSLEGYKLNFQLRWFIFVSRMYKLISLFQQALLWLNIRLIENCLMQLPKKQLEENENKGIAQIQEKLNHCRLNCKRRIKELEDCLHELRLKDVKKIIQPAFGKADLHGEDIDPINHLIEALLELDGDYIPERIKQSFEDNLGIKLKEDRAFLKEHLEKSWTKSEVDFVESYRLNRFAYV